MTSTDILSEIAQLVKKYEDVSSPVDLLHCISESARMEEANLLLGERLKRDVYSLFGKDDDGVMASNSGRALLEGARVTKLHTAKTCNVYHIDAEVQFRLPASSDSAIGKRKASPSAASAPEELVSVRYQYSEQTVASGSGTHSLQGFREKGVTVIESPYKSINLIVSASRGAAGLDAQNVVDFQLLTAGCSPSDQQVSLQDMMGAGGDDGNGSEGSADSEGSDGGEEEGSGGEGSDGEEGGEGMEEEDSEEGSEEGGDCEQGSEEGSAEGSEGASEGEQAEEGEDGVDTADYFSVQVSVEALAEVRDAVRGAVQTPLLTSALSLPCSSSSGWASAPWPSSRRTRSGSERRPRRPRPARRARRGRALRHCARRRREVVATKTRRGPTRTSGTRRWATCCNSYCPCRTWTRPGASRTSFW